MTIARRTPLARGGRIKPKKRKPSEAVRIYGPPGRREFVASQPCLLCGWHASQNAHTENGGKSRKGDATTILNLCGPHGFPMWTDGCHQKYEGRREALDLVLTERTGHGTAWHCADLEARWQSYSSSRQEPAR
jgi:hypothetical protein